MILSDDELRVVYESFVLPVHNDPLGYMARALMLSDGDTDYIDARGRVGFMPIEPERAFAELEVSDVQSLEGNVSATVLMDMEYWRRTGNREDAIILFHDGGETPSAETRQLLNDLPEARMEIKEVVAPRLATVDDVISLMTKKATVSKSRLDAFREILSAGH